MSNSQLSVLCTAFLAGSLIVAGTNVLMVRSAARVSLPARRAMVAVMPRMKGDAYFASCRKGAEEAARELGVELTWDAPTSLDSTGQIEIIETWITRHVDAIAVASADQAGISPVLRKARARGIPVITWDSDAQPGARDLFVNPAAPEETGRILADEAGCLLDGKGDVAILTGASHQCLETLRTRLSLEYPALKLAAIRPSEDRGQAFQETQALMKTHPSIRLIVALSPSALPGAAEAVLQSGRPGVRVIGVGLPASCRRYLDVGLVPVLVHWDTQDLGYLTVYTAALLARHRLDTNSDSLVAGRLGKREVCGGEIVLNPPRVERPILKTPGP